MDVGHSVHLHLPKKQKRCQNFPKESYKKWLLHRCEWEWISTVISWTINTVSRNVSPWLCNYLHVFWKLIIYSGEYSQSHLVREPCSNYYLYLLLESKIWKSGIDRQREAWDNRNKENNLELVCFRPGKLRGNMTGACQCTVGNGSGIWWRRAI